MSNNSDTCNIVNKIPSLKNYCTEEQKLLLKKSCVCYNYKKDDIIFREDFPLTHIGFVVSGVVGLWKENGDSQKQFLSFVKEEELFGFRSVEEQNNTYYNSAIAFDDTLICLLSKKNYDKLLLENPKFRLVMILNYVKKLETIRENFSNNARMNSREKIADALLKIYSLFENKRKNETYSKSIPRQFLSDLSGVSLGKTSHIISEFRKNNIISTSGSTIIFINPNKLIKIVERHYVN